MPPKLKKFYCGDEDDVPIGYYRRGSRYECMRKGVGVGMGIKEKEMIKKFKITPKKKKKESTNERENRMMREEKRPKKGSKEDYARFVNNNFGLAKYKAKINNQDLFDELAMMWKESKTRSKKKRSKTKSRIKKSKSRSKRRSSKKKRRSKSRSKRRSPSFFSF